MVSLDDLIKKPEPITAPSEKIQPENSLDSLIQSGKTEEPNLGSKIVGWLGNEISRRKSFKAFEDSLPEENPESFMYTKGYFHKLDPLQKVSMMASDPLMVGMLGADAIGMLRAFGSSPAVQSRIMVAEASKAKKLFENTKFTEADFEAINKHFNFGEPLPENLKKFTPGQLAQASRIVKQTKLLPETTGVAPSEKLPEPAIKKEPIALEVAPKAEANTLDSLISQAKSPVPSVSMAESVKPTSIVNKPWNPPEMFGINEKGMPEKVTIPKEVGLELKKPVEVSEFVGEVPSVQEPLPNLEAGMTPQQRLVKALKDVPPLRAEQEKIYSKERSERIARAEAQGGMMQGEKTFYDQLKDLSGELTKVQFESIRNKFSQEDIDALFNQIQEAPILPFTKISAKKGLAKLFGEYGGGVPTNSELDHLHQVFGKELTDALLDKRTMWERFRDGGYQVVNIPRSVMSSFGDLSFGLRQGSFAAPAYRKQFFDNWKKQFKVFGSEKAFQEVNQSIIKDPNYPYARRAGVAFTEMDGPLGLREERFASQWAEKLPKFPVKGLPGKILNAPGSLYNVSLGQVVRATGRAYSGFANKFRMDIFNDLVKQAEELGLSPKDNFAELEQIGDLVNAITGRGKLPKPLNGAALLLNSIFFSPRLMASRLTLLNPVYYSKWGGNDPFVRKQALKSALSYMATLVTILTLAKQSGIADVEMDPTSSDFLKLKVGNTRIDIMGGFQQYLVTLARLIAQKYKSSTTGEVKKLGEGFKGVTGLDIIGRFFESKFSPPASFATTMLRGKNVIGEEATLGGEAGKRLTPMIVSDAWDLIKEDPARFPLILFAIFGTGLQTYESKNPSNKMGVKSDIKSKRFKGSF